MKISYLNEPIVNPAPYPDPASIVIVDAAILTFTSLFYVLGKMLVVSITTAPLNIKKN